MEVRMKRKPIPSLTVKDQKDGPARAIEEEAPASLRSKSAAVVSPARARRRTRTGRHTGGFRGWGSRVSLRPAPPPTAHTADAQEALWADDRTVLDRANLFTEATRVP